MIATLLAGLPMAPSGWASTPCREIAGVMPPGATPSDCVTVEPGAGIRVPGTYCTVAFLVRGTDGTRYAITAGHCAVETKIGATVLAEDNRTPVGTLVYVEKEDRMPMRDTALVRLLPRTRASGRAEGIDGPHGMFTAMMTQPFKVQHVGRGTGTSQVRDVRTGLVLGATDPTVVHADLVVAPNDSGSPIFTEDGKAIGWVVSIASSSPADVSTSPLGGGAGWIVIRIAPVLARIGRALHTRLTLVNA